MKNIDLIKNASKVPQIESQLAEKASRSDLASTDTRIAQIIAHNGDGTKDTEIVDSRVNAKGVTYNSLGERLLQYDKKLIDFFGLKLPFVVGGLDTTSGNEVVAPARARSGLFYLDAGSIISTKDITYSCRILNYQSNGNYIKELTTDWVKTFTISSGGYYRILVKHDTLTDLTNVLNNITSSILLNLNIKDYDYLINKVDNPNISMNELNGDLQVTLSPLNKKINKTLNNYSETSNTAALANTVRFFPTTIFPKNCVINAVKLHSKYANTNTVTVEVWEIVGDKIILGKSVEKTYSSIGAIDIDISYRTNNQCYISVKNTNGFLSSTSAINCKIQRDITATTLNLSSFENYVDITPSILVNYSEYDNDFEKKKSIITVGAKGCDYTNIQDAIDNAQDSPSNKVTIIVYPGIYPRFSMVKRGDVLIPGNPLRYISIIGVNKYDCIIKDDSGNYHTPPAEVRTNGIIKNLTLIATHDVPTPDNCGSQHKSYAVHSDYGTEDALYEDCVMISYQAPAIGIGGAQNKVVKLKNCELYSYATADYGSLVNYGGLFYHSQSAEGITGQKLIIDNCRVYSKNGNKSLWIDKGTVVSLGCEVTIINSLFYGNACGKTVDVDLDLLTPDCYGNNVPSLNK